MTNKSFLSLKILFIFSSFCVSQALAADTLYQGGDALNSSITLVSKNGFFTLGFVRLGSTESNASYLGIWYNGDTSHPFWLANRDKPIADNSGVLAIDGSGNMKLTYSGGDLVGFYSGQSSTTNSTAILEDSGNFVLKDENSGRKQTLWQSFDYPTDTFLPGMKLGINRRTGQKWYLTSWLSNIVPGPAAAGAFTFEWDPIGKELLTKRRGVLFRSSGPLRSKTSFEEYSVGSGNFDLSLINVSNADEDYFMFTISANQNTPQGQRVISMWQLEFDGMTGTESGRRTMGGTVCEGNNTNGGCKIWAGPDCRSDRNSFKLTRGSFVNTVPRKIDNNASLSISDCKEICWKDCQCVGVNAVGSNANNTGCTFWNGSFTPDPNGSAVEFYVIFQDESAGQDTSGEKGWIWIILALVGFVLIMALAGLFWCQRRRRLREKYLNELMRLDESDDTQELENDGNKGHNLNIYSAATIVAATNSFAVENKLGQGGFGPVYKGKLSDGREIAVKRLSRRSGQGLQEFKNEIILLAKLQHMNLVRLLGCCIQGEEKMLVYEYMPNKSLDSFIFDQSKGKLIDWKKRYEIIEGIAQGLLYLHKYSRLRIIHRDLKASNILLDENLNPKISDFGMARIFKINTLEANTNRVVGTYGYMSPEYAMKGIFSVKSDVFSFGVLLLEIVSGRKTQAILQTDQQLSLVGYTWQLWREGYQLELVDPTLRDSWSKDQVLRCIHVGLLCVEENASDRPTMSDVISMLTSEAKLPLPKNPAFSNARSFMQEMGFSKPTETSGSINYVSMSTMDGR